MYEKELKKAQDVLKVYDEETQLNNKADEQTLKLFFDKVNNMFNYKLPYEYSEFLKQCNGYEFDGYILYGTDNFIENNLDYEEISNEYIIIGEYDIGFFVIRKNDNIFIELDKTSATEIEKFSSIEDMIKYVIIQSIK